MADELITKVEKQMEGTNLALAAVAEVLQKMDARFSNDEEAEIRKEEQDAAHEERMSLVKDIASEVVGILKQGGMDVDGTKVRSAGKIGKPSSADDSEKPASISSNIADQQATIQAMRKQEEEEEDTDEEDFPPKGGYMKTHVPGHEDDEEEDVEKEGADEYPEEEDEPEEEEKSMRKELRALKKQLASVNSNMEKTIAKEAESRLRKMGFREENGLQRPQRIETPLGVDGSTPLLKNKSNVDTIDQLTGMSYKQLRDLQHQIETGNTDGVPKELLN
tara:strand:+ start:6331 stop:7161 length:831 start_codon:yes stop_codon:yes gene_type:complete